jgi:hypothetical protein
MSRFISAIMACVLFCLAILVTALSCSPVSIVGALGTWLLDIPTTSLCYAFFPAIVGTIAGIVLSVLGGVAVLSTVLG